MRHYEFALTLEVRKGRKRLSLKKKRCANSREACLYFCRFLVSIYPSFPFIIVFGAKMHHVYVSMSTVVDDLLTELGCPLRKLSI